MNAPPPLAGRRILVTRPRDQADHLLALVRRAGGEGTLFPLIEIREPGDRAALQRIIDRLDEYDLAIFISPTAVTHGLAHVRARREWPRHLAVAAVGQGTARTLTENGFATILAPVQGGDSEALLALPEMSRVAGKRVLILRGQGGRELLAEILRQRGAVVDYAECYRRVKPDASARPSLESLLRGPLDALVITSTEALHNLLELCAGTLNMRLATLPLFVPHQRIAAAARDAGFTTVVVTAAGDAGLVEGMVKFFRA